MKNGLTLEAFAQKIEATALSARDFIMPAAHLRMTPAGELAWSKGQEGLMMPANATAGNQLTTYCEIPKQYANRCPATLRAINVNHWLDQHGNDKRLLRIADGHVRAFLSDRYRPLDNYDLAAHVLPVVQELGLSVESCNVTETKLYMKCVNEKVQGEVSPGDVIQSMVYIENSEVGHGALSITGGVFRLVCKNGLKLEQVVRKYHTGDRRKHIDQLSEALEVYCDDTRKKMDSALWAQVADLTRSAVSATLFEQIVAKMRDSKGGEQVKKPDAACEVMRKRFSLTEVESSSILAHLAKGGDLSRWGMLNAVTAAAQEVESYDRSTELEKLGGSILELNGKDWATIAG